MSSDGCMRIFSALLLLSLTVSLTATQNMHVPNTALAMMGPLKRVPVLVGNDAELPCDVLPTMANDHMLLVVWYRNDSPVYSYDKRILGPSAHWLEEAFVGRASWENALSVLHIRNVQPLDRDIYRCRVDFLLSPTKNYQIALDVIELPEKLVILDEFGKEINNVAGPYNEGSAFKLTCKVNGGVPSPSIKWLKGETILTSIPVGDLDTTTRGPRSLELSITNATRGYHASKYTCLVENTKLALPQSLTVRIDLFLRPLTVEILSRELPLSVGRKAELWCKSTGARPPANITWWLNGNLLDSSTKYNDPDRSESQSLLQWMPLKEDNGQVLTCRAEHARFDKSNIEATLPLNIFYMPEATMHLGSKMNPNDIEEGDDVYFECEVDANPPAYKVLWEHNGMLLQHNPSQGIILSANTNLVLQNVTRRQAGDYTCTASNVEGDGRSPPVRMQILYRPFCKQREMTLIGAMLLEPTSIECEVDAFPSPDNFHWFLNNSIGSNEVDPEKFTIDTKEGKSVLTYTPTSDVDYGTLSCRASNTAGQQVAPCVYRLLAATRPDPLSNCTVYNLTDDALDLTCLPGFEGGLPNIYFVEAWENGELLVNSSNGIPVWNLRRLGVRQQLRLVVYAANARGRSEQAALTVEIATRLFPRTEAQESWEIAWALSGVLGVVVSVAMLLCMGVAATKLRHRSRDYEATMQSTKNQKFSLQKRSSPDDCNPDLIPLRKELPKSCGPDPPSYSAVVSKSESKNSSAQSLARTPPPKSPSSPQLQSTQVQGSHRSVTRSTRPQREIVTTRTSLLLDPQESCV